MTPFAAWVLLLLVSLAPHSSYLATFPTTANAIARASEESPMFAGPKGVAQTAASVVATMMHESSLRPDAVGDCGKDDKGKCTHAPHSVCAMQVGVSNLEGLGVTREQLLADIEACVRAGLRMMHISATVCRARPLEERQAQYLHGGGECDDETALRRSRWRTRLARELVAKHPPP